MIYFPGKKRHNWRKRITKALLQQTDAKQHFGYWFHRLPEAVQLGDHSYFLTCVPLGFKAFGPFPSKAHADNWLNTYRNTNDVAQADATLVAMEAFGLLEC